GKVVRADRLMHGKTSLVRHDERTLFEGLPQPCEVGRYHSLIAAPASLPPGLEVSARTAEGEIMAVRHRALVVEGVQFHPESILTPEGPQLLANFLRGTAGERGEPTAAGAGHARTAWPPAAAARAARPLGGAGRGSPRAADRSRAAAGDGGGAARGALDQGRRGG